jgi:hypothetical protein
LILFLLLRLSVKNLRKSVLESTIKLRIAAIEQLRCAGKQGETFELYAPVFRAILIGDNLETLPLQIANGAHSFAAGLAAGSDSGYAACGGKQGALEVENLDRSRAESVN